MQDADPFAPNRWEMTAGHVETPAPATTKKRPRRHRKPVWFLKGPVPWPWLVLSICMAVDAELHLRASSEEGLSLPSLLLARGTWHAVFAPALFDAWAAIGVVAVSVALWQARNGATMQAGAPDLSGLEKDFVKVAKSYSTKKKISYGAWREFGVPSETLKKAGISRSA